MADRTTPPTAPTEHSATALLGQGMAHLDALCIAIAEVVEGDSSAICENARAIVADLIDAIEAKRIPGDTASCKLNTAMQLLIGVRALPGNTYTSTALLDIAIPLADALADVHHDMPEPDFAVLATLLLLVGERDAQKTVQATPTPPAAPASGPALTTEHCDLLVSTLGQISASMDRLDRLGYLGNLADPEFTGHYAAELRDACNAAGLLVDYALVKIGKDIHAARGADPAAWLLPTGCRSAMQARDEVAA